MATTRYTLFEPFKVLLRPLAKSLGVLNIEMPLVALPIANCVAPEIVMAGVPVSEVGAAQPDSAHCGPTTTSARSVLARLTARLVLSCEVNGAVVPPFHSTMRLAGAELPGVTAVA